jgi:dihydroorotase-like cyclic amidohydrolase
VSFELGIEGGTVVTASGRRRANVYMAGGKIAAIRTEQGPADRRIDAPRRAARSSASSKLRLSTESV